MEGGYSLENSHEPLYEIPRKIGKYFFFKTGGPGVYSLGTVEGVGVYSLGTVEGVYSPGTVEGGPQYRKIFNFPLHFGVPEVRTRRRHWSEVVNRSI